MLTTNGALTGIARAQRKTFRSRPSSRPFGQAPSRAAGVAAQLPQMSHDYDPAIAYLMSIVAGWAYSNGEILANKLEFYGFPRNSVEQISVVNEAMSVVASAYFIRSGDGRAGILAFRGTEPVNFINWLTNADTRLRTFRHGQVHGGFYMNVEAIWADIVEAIESAIDPLRSPNGQEAGAHEHPKHPLEALYLTGHSLGAAMAVIAAARIFTNEYAHWQPLVRGVYTFGQPMVGDADFANHYSPKFGHMLHRHVYGYDLVPRLPPLSVGRFQHFGQQRMAGASDTGWKTSPNAKQALAVVTAAVSAVGDFAIRRQWLLRKLALPYSLDDHSPLPYIETSRVSIPR